jgi:hypothetical protein
MRWLPITLQKQTERTRPRCDERMVCDPAPRCGPHDADPHVLAKARMGIGSMRVAERTDREKASHPRAVK